MKRSAIFSFISTSLISIFFIGLVHYTSPVFAAEGCPLEYYPFSTAQECNDNCVGGQCKVHDDGVARCCGLTDTGGLCPASDTFSYGTPQTCAQNCRGVCVDDAAGFKRCCRAGADTDDTNGDDQEIPPFIETPLGTIPTDAAGFAAWAINFALGLGVLLAILIIVIGGFGVVTSAGDPEKLQKSKERITAAVAGLLFILASALILNIIGGGIIGIPFFGG